MKQVVTVLLLFPLWAMGIQPAHLHSMLNTAAEKQSGEYIKARNEILAEKNVLPILLSAATNAALSWQQHLVARICVERLLRSNDISTLRSHDWRCDAQYDPRWEHSLVGSIPLIGRIAIPHFRNAGLWYYYVEVSWKSTDERAIGAWDQRMESSWAGWCVEAVKGQPEEHYLREVRRDELAHALDNDPNKALGAYLYLIECRDSDSVPLLVEKYDVYFRGAFGDSESYIGENKRIYRNRFMQLVGIADCRHVAIIEDFIKRSDRLREFGINVEPVRQRQPRGLSAEPPLRYHSGQPPNVE